MFEQTNRDPCFDGEELFGIGQLLKTMSKEVSALEDILRCGYDSMAVKKKIDF